MNKKTISIFIITIFGIWVLGFIIWLLLTPVPKEIKITDISTNSFAISWLTDKPIRGCAITKLGKSKTKACDDKKTKAHLITIANLAPENTYQIIVTSGLIKETKSLPKITTNKIQEEQPRTPEPAYGSVEWENTNQPIKNALIYFQNPAQNKKEVFVALTNEKGNYAIDLSNFENLERTILVEVVVNPATKTRNELDSTRHSPFPTLLIPGP
ncbi:MAG: hypothetical protein Q8P91_02460 [bacterium]|nr:hypothetical protein [bacterium]